MDHPRIADGSAHGYDLGSWYQLGTNDTVTAESNEETIELMSNEKGTMDVLNSTQDYTVSMNLISELDWLEFNTSAYQVSPDGLDEGYGDNLERNQSKRQVMLYIENTETGLGLLLTSCANMSADTMEFANDQTTFPVELKPLPADEWNGVKFVKYTRAIS